MPLRCVNCNQILRAVCTPMRASGRACPAGYRLLPELPA